ncbi:unnamed protein product, partial [marine sediment metagenome]
NRVERVVKPSYFVSTPVTVATIAVLIENFVLPPYREGTLYTVVTQQCKIFGDLQPESEFSQCEWQYHQEAMILM